MNPKIIYKKESDIVSGKRQLAVRIPMELVNKFEIDPSKDKIQWIAIQEGNEISMEASLVKNEK